MLIGLFGIYCFLGIFGLVGNALGLLDQTSDLCIDGCLQSKHDDDSHHNSNDKLILFHHYKDLIG